MVAIPRSTGRFSSLNEPRSTSSRRQPIVPCVSPLSRSLLVACVLVALAACSRARADAIKPAPEECPLGTEPRTDHAGPRCEPRFCGRDVAASAAPVDCGEGARCRDALLRFAAPVEDRRPGSPTVSAFEGDCACPRETCVRADVCVPDVSPVEHCAGETPRRAEPVVDGPAVEPVARGGCASCRALGARETPRHAQLVAIALAVLVARLRSSARARVEAR